MWKTFEDDNFGLQNCRSSMENEGFREHLAPPSRCKGVDAQNDSDPWIQKATVSPISKWLFLLHPRKLTWIPKIAIFEMRFILKTIIFLVSM